MDLPLPNANMINYTCGTKHMGICCIHEQSKLKEYEDILIRLHMYTTSLPRMFTEAFMDT